MGDDANVIAIVNADDFGRSPGINRGVARAFEEGIVTSASLMVRWPSAEEASRYARSHPDLSVGIHIDLAEWEFRDGEWRALYRVVDPSDEKAVRSEIEEQLRRFEELMGAQPTHIDSHQHVHREEPARSVTQTAAELLGVPLREELGGVRYVGSFYGQMGTGEALPDSISLEAMLAIIASLEPGVSEIACHPAAEADIDSVYAQERVQELEVLCDPRVRDALEARGVTVTSYTELTKR